MRNRKKTTTIFSHFAGLKENIGNGNTPFCLFLLPFPLFPVLFPKTEQGLWHIWLHSLWNHFAVRAFLILLKWTKEGLNWGKGSKQISAFADVSNMCISHASSWGDWIGCSELVLYWSHSLCFRKNKNRKSVCSVCVG